MSKREVYLNWANSVLSEVGQHVQGISSIQDGQVLCQLIDILCPDASLSQKLQASGARTPQSYVQAALEHMKRNGVKLSFSTQDILDGDIKSMLDVLWLIILNYGIHSIERNVAQRSVGIGKKLLLDWCQRELDPAVFDPRNTLTYNLCTGDWFIKLLKKQSEFAILRGEDKVEHVKVLLQAIEDRLSVKSEIINPSDIVDGTVDEHTLMIYIALVKRKLGGDELDDSVVRRLGDRSPLGSRDSSPAGPKEKSPERPPLASSSLPRTASGISSPPRKSSTNSEEDKHRREGRPGRFIVPGGDFDDTSSWFSSSTGSSNDRHMGEPRSNVNGEHHLHPEAESLLRDTISQRVMEHIPGAEDEDDVRSGVTSSSKADGRADEILSRSDNSEFKVHSVKDKPPGESEHSVASTLSSAAELAEMRNIQTDTGVNGVDRDEEVSIKRPRSPTRIMAEAQQKYDEAKEREKDRKDRRQRSRSPTSEEEESRRSYETFVPIGKYEEDVKVESGSKSSGDEARFKAVSDEDVEEIDITGRREDASATYGGFPHQFYAPYGHGLPLFVMPGQNPEMVLLLEALQKARQEASFHDNMTNGSHQHGENVDNTDLTEPKQVVTKDSIEELESRLQAAKDEYEKSTARKLANQGHLREPDLRDFNGYPVDGRMRNWSKPAVRQEKDRHGTGENRSQQREQISAGDERSAREEPDERHGDLRSGRRGDEKSLMREQGDGRYIDERLQKEEPTDRYRDMEPGIRGRESRSPTERYEDSGSSTKDRESRSQTDRYRDSGSSTRDRESRSPTDRYKDSGSDSRDREIRSPTGRYRDTDSSTTDRESRSPTDRYRDNTGSSSVDRDLKSDSYKDNGSSARDRELRSPTDHYRDTESNSRDRYSQSPTGQYRGTGSSTRERDSTSPTEGLRYSGGNTRDRETRSSKDMGTSTRDRDSRSPADRYRDASSSNRDRESPVQKDMGIYREKRSPTSSIEMTEKRPQTISDTSVKQIESVKIEQVGRPPGTIEDNIGISDDLMNGIDTDETYPKLPRAQPRHVGSSQDSERMSERDREFQRETSPGRYRSQGERSPNHGRKATEPFLDSIRARLERSPDYQRDRQQETSPSNYRARVGWADAEQHGRGDGSPDTRRSRRDVSPDPDETTLKQRQTSSSSHQSRGPTRSPGRDTQRSISPERPLSEIKSDKRLVKTLSRELELLKLKIDVLEQSAAEAEESLDFDVFGGEMSPGHAGLSAKPHLSRSSPDLSFSKDTSPERKDHASESRYSRSPLRRDRPKPRYSSRSPQSRSQYKSRTSPVRASREDSRSPVANRSRSLSPHDLTLNGSVTEEPNGRMSFSPARASKPISLGYTSPIRKVNAEIWGMDAKLESGFDPTRFEKWRKLIALKELGDQDVIELKQALATAVVENDILQAKLKNSKIEIDEKMSKTGSVLNDCRAHLGKSQAENMELRTVLERENERNNALEEKIRELQEQNFKFKTSSEELQSNLQEAKSMLQQATTHDMPSIHALQDENRNLRNKVRELDMDKTKQTEELMKLQKINDKAKNTTKELRSCLEDARSERQSLADELTKLQKEEQVSKLSNIISSYIEKGLYEEAEKDVYIKRPRAASTSSPRSRKDLSKINGVVSPIRSRSASLNRSRDQSPEPLMTSSPVRPVSSFNIPGKTSLLGSPMVSQSFSPYHYDSNSPTVPSHHREIYPHRKTRSYTLQHGNPYTVGRDSPTGFIDDSEIQRLLIQPPSIGNVDFSDIDDLDESYLERAPRKEKLPQKRAWKCSPSNMSDSRRQLNYSPYGEMDVPNPHISRVSNVYSSPDRHSYDENDVVESIIESPTDNRYHSEENYHNPPSQILSDYRRAQHDKEFETAVCTAVRENGRRYYDDMDIQESNDRIQEAERKFSASYGPGRSTAARLGVSPARGGLLRGILKNAKSEQNLSIKKGNKPLRPEERRSIPSGVREERRSLSPSARASVTGSPYSSPVVHGTQGSPAYFSPRVAFRDECISTRGHPLFSPSQPAGLVRSMNDEFGDNELFESKLVTNSPYRPELNTSALSDDERRYADMLIEKYTKPLLVGTVPVNT